MRILPIVLTCSTLLASANASAEGASFQVEQFEPLPAQGTNLGNLASSRPLGHLSPSVGIRLKVADVPLPVRTNDDVTARLVDDQLKAELGLGIGLFGWLDAGFVLPLVLMQSTEQTAAFANVGSGAGLADVRFVPRVRLLDAARAAGFGVAVLLPLYLPTGNTSSFNGDGGVRVEPRLALDWAHAMGLRVLANFAYQIRGEQAALNYVNDDVFRFAVGVEAPTGYDPLRATATLFGNASLRDGRDPADLSLSAANTEAQPLEAQIGARWTVTETLLAHLGTGIGLTSDVGSPDFRITGGIEWTPVIRLDSDGDGLDNEKDACPREAEDFDGFADSDGCPEADNDEDGFPDRIDRCPNKAEDLDQFEDLDGCPEADNDEDGLADDADRCPNVEGLQELMGCPPEDTDGDEIADHLEQCPEAPEDFDGFEDEDGCPDPDNDNDGLRDDLDRCPNEAEVVNNRDDTDGCADRGESLIVVLIDEIQTTVPLEFSSGAGARNQGRKILNQLASAMTNHSRISKLRIDVHTSGTADEDVKLANERAMWVEAYLVQRGVAPERLEHGVVPGARPLDEAKPESANRATFVVTAELPLVLPRPEPPEPVDETPEEAPEEPEEREGGGDGFDFSEGGP